MKKRFLIKLTSITVAFAVIFCGSFFGNGAFASVDDKQNELSGVKEEIDQTQNQIRENEAYLSELNSSIADINDDIYDLQSDIDSLSVSIEETKAEITVKLGELSLKEKEISKQDDDLSARLRAMYKNGNAGMLSVLIHSTSITSLLTNIEMAKKIYTLDQNLLNKMRGEYDEIYQAKLVLTNLKDSLVSQQNELEAAQSNLSAQQAELELKQAEVRENTEELKAQEDALKARADSLVEEIRQLQTSATYSGGDMCWPSAVTSRITSPFGYRYIFGGYSFHTGIDIGAWYGSDILAANSGEVIMVGWDPSGYGNYVMIDHGGGVVTLYGHQSQVLVSIGQYVKRGQVIGLIGSTGLSTGPHLHFEIRINGRYQDPMDESAVYHVVPDRYIYD